MQSVEQRVDQSGEYRSVGSAECGAKSRAEYRAERRVKQTVKQN